MNQHDATYLSKKAKGRKDGVYRAKGWVYAVKGGKVVALGDREGYLWRFLDGVVMAAGKVEPWEVGKALTEVARWERH